MSGADTTWMEFLLSSQALLIIPDCDPVAGFEGNLNGSAYTDALTMSKLAQQNSPVLFF